MICHCGTTLYRSLDGYLHCFRCESRTDLCPGCEGRGYRLKGRSMAKCTTCDGTGQRPKTPAHTFGSRAAPPTDGCYCAAPDPVEASVSPDAGRKETGRSFDCCSINDEV